MNRHAASTGMFLLDAGMSGGGSGKRIGSERLRGLNAPRPWLLAGGLTPENVKETVAACVPDGVDFNSGLESEPGRKDPFTYAGRINGSERIVMKKGYFGEFGGCFVPELLMPPLQELEEAMRDIMPSPTFKEELDDLLRNFAGRETPLTYCPTLSKRLGFSLWLKREDLLHTGAHKVNNTLGQALLAKHMGKTALVAETGAGQHGVATAAAARPSGA